MRPAIGLALTIARRELRAGLRGFWVMLLCLMLGVAAIAAVGLVRGAITSALSDQGAVLLGGDAQYEFTYRRATPGELDWIKSHSSALSEVIEFRSMLSTGTDAADRALTQVKAVDGAYPLTGKLQLDPPVGVDALKGEGGTPGIFLDPILANRLGVKPGDRVELGGQSFVMMAEIKRVPDSTGTGFALGPPSIVALSAIQGTSLLAPGSLFETEYRVSLPPGTDLATLHRQAESRFADAGMRWSDRRRAAPGAQRFVDRLGSFLVLVGLAGLAVGGVGISATVASWVERKAGTIATLRALGATGATIRAAFLIQLIALGAIGILAGLGLGVGLVLAASSLIENALPIPVAIRVTPGPLGEAALYGALIAAIFALWPLSRMAAMRAASLYRDIGDGRRFPPWPTVAITGVLLVVLVVVSAWFSGLWGLTLASLGGIALALLILSAAAWGIRRAARAGQHLARGRPALRAALAAIGGPRSEARSVILSLGLGLSVLAAVGQVDSGLRSAIDQDLPKRAPAYFVIDIQPDQIDPFKALLAKMPEVTKVEAVPMLRGVITQINGQNARKVAGEHWVLRGDRGVTYSDVPREKLTAGKWWPKNYDGPPLASFSAKEAEEIGLKLGDNITVNILGRDITAKVTSFRDVDFSTGGIGFVLTLDPAALQGAPHTWLATIYAPPKAEAAVMRDLAKAFPNITAIRVRDAIERVTDALGAIARATSLAASVTLLTGFVVLIGAAAAGERARAWEAAMLKTLGATRGTILLSFALRSALMGAAAGLVAVLFGGLAGWAVVDLVMGAPFHFAPWPAFLIVAGGVIATLGAGLIFAWRPLSRRPAGELRGSE
ncbi:putative ABC transport system permease protein [Thioclava dalianensis]|uniref:ABC transporter permease n=1 Tax=Thioclava dalianensis TaxID=1185766 RepID=UPI0005713742|nr:FtsX-like permease family protein [Thioclava dalianensis]SFM82445.1 putative ABC transport system permease protein [Thioclava dalianensis]